ncbi:MAG TPA: hypothetical protein VH988_30810 [Thermoanaerobaculia bacterium]|jgi:hypothetical protein|nr:hypothetical protein [Thermoanaerobaculia bacterium]
MKIALKSLLALSCGLFAVAAANAAPADHIIYTPIKGGQVEHAMDKSLLTNHGGGVIVNPHLVYLFWGPSFCTGGADAGYAATLQAYRNQFGSTGEWKTINQYGVAFPDNLAGGTADAFDCTAPPTNVTDTKVKSHVTTYLSTHTFDNSAIYEVVIPSTSYSSSGTSTSCGGPSLAYCAYHSSYSTGGHTAKYSIQPWASCSGCQISGWSNVQNQEHFVCHETREAATDPVNGWWDGTTGEEADDKCAWGPPPFLVPGTDGTGNIYGYQYEWSNADNGCVKTK